MVQVALRWTRHGEVHDRWETVDLQAQPADPSLASLLPPGLCLREGVLPWRCTGAVTVVLCADPSGALDHLQLLEATLGPVRLARADPRALRAALAEIVGRPMAIRAERRLPPLASCRNLPGGRLTRFGLMGAGTTLAALILAPASLLAVLAVLATATLVIIPLTHQPPDLVSAGPVS